MSTGTRALYLTRPGAGRSIPVPSGSRMPRPRPSDERP